MAVPTDVAEPTRAGVVLLMAVRLLLLAGLLVGGYRALDTPDDRPLTDLTSALAAGQVDKLTVQVARPGGPGVGSAVLWSTGRLRSHVSHYRTPAEGPDALLDEVRASPQPPELTTTGRRDVDPRTRSAIPLAVVVAAGVAGLLRVGPQPRRATRWAWWWLGAALPLAWVAFVVLEPRPLWRTNGPAPGARRLTGGRALLAGLVGAAVVRAWRPELTGASWG